MSEFMIKPGYRSHSRPRAYTDTLEDSRLYQVPVYRHAGDLADSPDMRSVLDIGCGRGTKLMELVAPHGVATTGVDSRRSIRHCRRTYPQGEWLVGNIESPRFTIGRTFDLIISADVVEHLRNPDHLLDLIRACSHQGTVVILSTPERDLRRGPDDMGPPGNPAHIREWNAAEFEAYLTDRGFSIAATETVDLRPGAPTCQMVTGSFEPGRNH